MPAYHLVCPNCGSEFDFDFDPILKSPMVYNHGMVFYYGLHTFSVKCGQCKKRNRYHVNEEDRIG